MFQVGQASAESNTDGIIANLAMGPEVVDRALRRIANAERRLEHDKAHLFTQAVRLRIWSHFGRGSPSAYLEEVFGYTPKVARTRARGIRDRQGDRDRCGRCRTCRMRCASHRIRSRTRAGDTRHHADGAAVRVASRSRQVLCAGLPRLA